ncbi:hypothetical protein ACWGKU_04275 [Kitasatospora sp. NPDC054768]
MLVAYGLDRIAPLGVRRLAAAADGADAFELRCQLREHLVGYLRDHHPYALPRLPVAPAPGSSRDAGAVADVPPSAQEPPARPGTPGA